MVVFDAWELVSLVPFRLRLFVRSFSGGDHWSLSGGSLLRLLWSRCGRLTITVPVVIRAWNVRVSSGWDADL